MTRERFYSPQTRYRLAIGMLIVASVSGFISIGVRHVFGSSPGANLLTNLPIILYAFMMLAYLWFERRYRRRMGR